MPPQTQTGTALSDLLTGTGENDTLIGAVGDDTLNGLAGGDHLIGDHATANQLTGTDDATGFGDYAASGAWTVSALDDGHQQMVQQIGTEIGGVYRISLDIAANFAAGRSDAAVEVLVNGVLIATLETDGGAYATHELSFTADSTSSEITLRSVDLGEAGPVLITSTPAIHHMQTMDIGGQSTDVAVFAEGQAKLYQVLNGTLYVFDPETETYQQAGVSGTVNVNSMGYNVQDNLLYAIAVSNGVDSLGQAVSRSDLVMLDALGNSYRIGDTPYRSWTGDFDDQGNLWSFQSSMNHIAVIDVDALDGAGNPQVTVHKLPRDLIGFSVYDVAYDAASQCFYGLTRPSSEGQDTLLLVVDISSGDPVFTTVPVTGTRIDGTLQAGAPAMTYGAAILDAEGNLFIGGNAGDHDMNDTTSSAGGIYQVHIENGSATLELISDAPKSYSNDGAADPRAQSPFDPVDLSSSVLLRNLSLVATAEGVLSYDDSLSGEAGADTLEGGIGLDTLLGGSAGDMLYGQDGDDALYGGAGPNSDSAITSVYDENGLRYDLFGNLLGADDDHLLGGTGADTLSGSAGHDTLDGGAASDLLIGGSGLDLLIGGAGADLLQGGAQADVLQGGSGNDTLFGGSDTDLLLGGEDADSLSGGSGADTLQGDAGADNLSGGSGGDFLEGGRGDDALDGGSGDDTLQGDSGDDHLAAGSGSDQIAGGDGNDNLIGGTGDDTLQGEDGRDSLRGGSGGDLLQGGDDGDHLNGGAGDDTLLGGAGRDRLYLGAGADIATGGADADRFVFRNGALDGSDNTITDFSVSEGDRLDLRGLEISNGADWLEETLSVTGDDLRLSLGNGTVLLLSDAADQAEILIDQILF